MDNFTNLPVKIYPYKSPENNGILFKYIFFSITFFWVVSHWVIYNILVTKLYPYKNWKKFFVDVALFSIMAITLNLSFYAYNNFFLFNLSIIIWHSLAFLWHLCDNIKSSKHKGDLLQHSIRIVVYLSILVLFVLSKSVLASLAYCWLWCFVSLLLAMVILNMERRLCSLSIKPIAEGIIFCI